MKNPQVVKLEELLCTRVSAKLTPADVRSIRESKQSAAEIAKHFKMTVDAIHKVRGKRTWAWVE